MPYDIFISYSRRDDDSGRITQLKEQIEKGYLDHTGEALSCFFDKTEIKVMEDWRNRILGGLRESKLLLLVLSPEYLKSNYCEWEITEFLKYEHSRFVQGEGVAQIYFVEIPGLDTPGFEAQSAAWVARVRQKNHVDLRPWHQEGADALKQADVKNRLEDLERSLVDRLSRLRRIASAPGNLPAHNPKFVGRTVEMDRLHKSAGLGQFGLLTAVQGVGGMGKTALAIQYAHAYADFYPGGRWMMGCAGKTTLAQAIRSLDMDLDIQFSDEEKMDDIRAAKRVLSILKQMAEEGAKARANEKKPPSPKALLIFDNVDAPTLLQPPETDLISGKPWLHVIATTRLTPESIGTDPALHCHLPVDELPEEDAVRLIESYQPQGLFPNNGEREAAHSIARLLCGFTLAVEVAAVYLADNKGRVTCSDLLKRLEKQGIDPVGRETKGGIRYSEKLISATLKPTLETLTEKEKLVLTLAALLPPEAVVLPWLRAAAAKDHPEFEIDAEPGYIDPWFSTINHLMGLRLLQAIEWTDDGKTPRICRMHRLVQIVVREAAGDTQKTLQAALVEIAKEHADFLTDEEGWIDRQNRWEIEPLGVLSIQMIDTCGDILLAVHLINKIGICFQQIGKYQKAATLFERALEAREHLLDYEQHIVLTEGNLARLYRHMGEYDKAELLFERVIKINERLLGPEHPVTVNDINSLAVLYRKRGNYDRSQVLYERVLEVYERIYGPEHPKTLLSMNNLAVLFDSKNDFDKALPLYQLVFKTQKRVLGPEHPETLNSMNNLAGLLADKGEYDIAMSLFLRVLEARRRILGPEHPDTLLTTESLAGLYAKSDKDDALELYQYVMKMQEKVLGPEHPQTINCINSLAELLNSKGHYDKAQHLYEQTLKVKEKTLGYDHPETISNLNILAGVVYRKGDNKNALHLFQCVLEYRERVLGPDHPETLCTVNDLAGLLTEIGDHNMAILFFERVLEGRKRILGPEHPDTLLTMNNFGQLFKAKEEYYKALPLFERVVEGLFNISRKNGQAHPNLKAGINNFAGCFKKLGYNEKQIIDELRKMAPDFFT